SSQMPMRVGCTRRKWWRVPRRAGRGRSDSIHVGDPTPRLSHGRTLTRPRLFRKRPWSVALNPPNTEEPLLRSLFKRRPSAPMAISLVALFMSVGGVGYAATSLPSDSVGTSQIRSEAVTYKKIRPGNVGSVRLANEGVTYGKIHPGAVGK